MPGGFGAILSMGGSCFVSYVDKEGQRRSYCSNSCEELLAREYAIYRHLGKHNRILRCFGLDEIHSPGVHALGLELAPLGTVRDLIHKQFPNEPLPEQTRLQICRNPMVFDGYCVKFGDFGGSIIRGRESSFPETVAEEPRYELPCRGREMRKLPTVKRELFALGTCMYEIMAWMRSFHELPSHEVGGRYERSEFPSLDNIPVVVAQAIRNCWHEIYDCVEEVVELLEE
ncbi:kinase-like protein [Nemania sp. FL0031]|nr:kinase-like protein [Nemania sp. FL0031]